MDKTVNQKAWFLVLPVFLVVAFSAVLPLMTVVNYSMQDTFGNNQFFWNGVGWFKELLDPSTDLGGRFLASLGRNLFFSMVILAIEVPLGIVVALSMPREGWTVAACLVILALPLLIPWNVVGTIWQIFGRPDIGLLGYTLNAIGIDYNYVSNAVDAWITVIVMDVWHWTSLVALLCYAGLKSIPEAYYQAAQIDGASRWAVFRAIQLPKMNRVLLIAVLLRFMDCVHDLHRAFRRHRRRARQLDHLRVDRAGQDRARPVRPRQGRSTFAGLQSDHPDRLLDLLYRHDQCRQRTETPGRSRVMHSIPGRRLIMGLFLIFLLLPIYWLVNMSFKTNAEIVSTMTLWPHAPTLQHYKRIFTDESWYSGYINSLEYVILNTIISISVALPAAYAFSRYRFLGDKHLFFWLLSNRMAPAAVYALPFFNLYSAIGLFDTPWAVALAHCIFNVPLAVWILEGFVSGVPREIDETAFLDGYSFPRFFIRILVPLIASGIGVAAFFCFMFSWVELLLARTLTSVQTKPIAAIMTRTVSAAGMDWGLLAAAGVLTIIPGALVIWFVRNYIARGFALGRV